ncbi:hypothetical protein LCGC14_0911950, partial [marine sediment metagenome]
SLFRDIVVGPHAKLAMAGADAVGLRFPETARVMRQRNRAHYGEAGSKATDIYGTVVSTAAQITALLPLGPWGFAAAYAAMGAGGVRTDIAELRAQGVEISGKQEAIAAGLTGGVEGISGIVGWHVFGRIAGRLAAESGGKISKAAIEAAFKRGGSRAVARLMVTQTPKVVMAAAPGSAAEGLEEGITQYINNGIAIATYDPERDRFEGVLESGLIGAGMGPLGGAVQSQIRGDRGPAKETKKQQIARLEQGVAVAQKEARTDELTQLGNRLQEKEDIERIYSEADQTGESVAVVETDLGNFKAVNDTLGHEVGDSVIRAAGESMQEAIRAEERRDPERGEGRDSDAGARPADTIHSVNRVGGDEFPIKLRGVGSQAAVDSVMARAQKIFAEKVEAIIGDRLPAEAHPFIAWGAEIRSPGDTRTPEQLMKAAEARITDRKTQTKKVRGTPETREELTRLIAERQPKPDAEQQEVKVIPQDEVVDHVGEHADKEAFNQLVEEVGEDFVEVEITVDDVDIGALTKQTLSEKKANEFADMDAETAPPVVGFAGKGGKLRIRDGQHRVIAAAMRGEAKRAGKVKAIVPRSWAEGKGLIPKADEAGSLSKSEEVLRAINPKLWADREQRRLAETQSQEEQNTERQEAALEPQAESESEEILLQNQKLLPPDKRYKTTEPQRKRVRDLLAGAGKAIKGGYVEWLSTRGGRTDEWFRTKDRMRTEKNLTQHDLATLLDKGDEAFKKAGWNRRNPADQRAVTSAINGEIPVTDLPAPLQDFVNQARLAIDTVSLQAADLFEAVGLKKQAKVYRENVGKYLKAMFHNKSQGGLPKKALRLANSFYKFKRDRHAVVSRTGTLVKKYDTRAEALAHIEKSSEKSALRYVEPLTAEYRSEYQIDDPFFLVARSIAETKHNMEVVRLFHLAATTEAVKPPDGLEGPELAAWAKENGLVKLPGRGIFHELHKKYVPKVVAEDLMEVIAVPNTILRSLRAYERAFKEANTVLNPATHGTNAIGNTMVFSWLDGNTPFNPVKFVRYYVPALKHLLGKTSRVYRLALKHGMIRSDFVSVEIEQMGDPAKGYDSMLQSRMKRIATAPLRVARRIYELEDTWFKMASFLRHMDRGMSPEEAAQEVDRSYPNYNHLSKITKWIKRVPLLSPFVSFADQGPKKVLNHAKTPGGAIRIAAPYLALQFLDELGKWWLTDEQRILIEEAKSDSIIERQFQVVLPGIRNNRGAPVIWDLRNYIPFIRDVPTQRGSTLVVSPFTGPLVQGSQAQLSGTDTFTGHQFIREDQTWLENLAARGRQAFKSFAPIPSILRHSPASIERATATGLQDTALAILRALTGVRVDTPYIKERHVRSIVEEMILTDSFDEAEALVDTWNEQFRPLNRKELVFSNLMSAVDRRLTDRYNRALETAANKWIDGDFKGALREAKTYNKGKSDYAYEITEEDIKWKAEDFRAEGKTRGKY